MSARRHVFAVLALALLAGLATARPVTAQAPADSAAQAWAAGDHDLARRLYAERVAADPADMQALHRLGLLLAWNRQFDEAIPLLEELVRRAPSRPARTDLANALGWSGRHARAAAVWQALLDDDPADVEALRGLARVTTWSGDLRGGERLWRQALEAEPGNAAAHIGLSQLLRWTGRPREALTHARMAVQLQPDDGDAQEQLAWAEAALGPRVAPIFTAESDSDDNRLLTSGLTASAPLTSWLDVTLRGWIRRADGPTPLAVDGGARQTQGGSAGVSVEPVDGWRVSAAAGMTRRPEAAGGATGTWEAGVASPARLPVNVSVAYARAVLDATADLMARGVTTRNLTMNFTARLPAGTRLEAGAGVNRFHGETVNRQDVARLGLELRPAPWLRVRPRATAFRFSESVSEGYFAPDEYVLGEVGVGVERYGSTWSLTAEVAPGAQRIGSDGDATGAFSARGRIGYTIAPGRELGLGLAFSNLGMERLTVGASGYRYQAVTLSMRWGL